MKEKKLKNIVNDYETILAITKNEVLMKGNTIEVLTLYRMLTENILRIKFVDKNVLDKVYSSVFEDEENSKANSKEGFKKEDIKKSKEKLFKFLEELFGE